MGVANKRSIAWGIAEAFQREGAELAFTYAIDRLRENVEELVATLPDPKRVPVLPCDVSQDAQVAELFKTLEERWGTLDVLVPQHRLRAARGAHGQLPRHHPRRLPDRPRRERLLARRRLARGRAAPAARRRRQRHDAHLLRRHRVVPSYNVMAIAKAALEAEVRYLAADLGRENIRVNAISAGPIKTLAASAVKGLQKLQKSVEEQAPLRRNVTQDEVGDVAVFLASPLSRCITGATLFADCGFSIVGKGHESA